MMMLLTILVMIPCIQGFLITRAEPGILVVAPGEKVTLSCAVDDHYEWCKWFHPGGQFCDFEWKRSQNNITMQECSDLQDRVSFHGIYDDKECGITFTAQEEDTGIWKCEIEEYVTWRSRGAGRIEEAELHLTVQSPTTPPTPPTTVRTSTEAATDEIPSTHTITSTDAVSTAVDAVTETPEAEPRVDEKEDSKAGGSSTAVVGVVIVLIIIVVTISGAVYYRRRRNSSIARAVYEREAKTSHDQTSMVTNSSSNITFHSGNQENSNLHEYYPPNLTYSTVTPESQA